MMSDPEHHEAQIHTDGVTLRQLAGDEAAARRLAQLDSHPPLRGTLLGAEIDGRLLAAISLTTGESVADPYSRASELRALLELRAAQLRRRDGHRPRRRGFPLRSRARATLPGSPPGAPGWLMARRPRGF